MPVVCSHPVGGPLAVAVLANQTEVPRRSDTGIQSVFPDRNRRFIYPTEVDQEELFLSFFFLVLQVSMFPTDILLSNFPYRMPRAMHMPP